MFGSMLDKATGWLDQRLITTILLPALVFWSGIGALVITHLGWDRAGHWWNGLNSTQQIVVAGGALSALLLFALLVQIALPVVIRGYEGYWMLRGWASHMGRVGIARQLKLWQRLRMTDPRDYARRYRQFPPDPDDLLPTRFGNALRAAELYACDQRRYGIDAVFFWPRLYPLLPDALRTSLGAARASLEQMLVVSSLSGLFALITAILGGLLPLPPVVWPPVLAGTSLLSLLAYRAAVSVAMSYGELIRSAFDTHRRALLSSIGLEPPGSLKEERELWKALGQQLYRRDADRPELIRFTTDQANSPQAPTEQPH